jgi:hypothetical protein
MEIEFAFRKESSGLFGSIGRPVARVIVIHRRRRVPQLFYVDSGADITLIPKSVGDLLGLTLASPQEIRETKGSANGESPSSYVAFGSRSAPRYFPPGLVGASSKRSPYS